MTISPTDLFIFQFRSFITYWLLFFYMRNLVLFETYIGLYFCINYDPCRTWFLYQKRTGIICVFQRNASDSDWDFFLLLNLFLRKMSNEFKRKIHF